MTDDPKRMLEELVYEFNEAMRTTFRVAPQAPFTTPLEQRLKVNPLVKP